ncbi:MAG: hypothetical protein ACRD27_04110, partial [Terracidiphilus sp.]
GHPHRKRGDLPVDGPVRRTNLRAENGTARSLDDFSGLRLRPAREGKDRDHPNGTAERATH